MHDRQAAVSPHMDENISKEGRNKQGRSVCFKLLNRAVSWHKWSRISGITSAAPPQYPFCFH
eukprot:8929364-Heterocapsa_arctica.AAC.1